jgi:hypothetical protein
MDIIVIGGGIVSYFEMEREGFPKRDTESWGDYWKRLSESQVRSDYPEYAAAKDALALLKKEWNERWPETMKGASLLCEDVAILAEKCGESGNKYRALKGQIKNNDNYADQIKFLCSELDRFEGCGTPS